MARISEDLDKKRIVALVIFALVITVLAWQSDDAYHGYVMAKHLVETVLYTTSARGLPLPPGLFTHF